MLRGIGLLVPSHSDTNTNIQAPDTIVANWYLTIKRTAYNAWSYSHQLVTTATLHLSSRLILLKRVLLDRLARFRLHRGLMVLPQRVEHLLMTAGNRLSQVVRNLVAFLLGRR